MENSIKKHDNFSRNRRLWHTKFDVDPCLIPRILPSLHAFSKVLGLGTMGSDMMNFVLGSCLLVYIHHIWIYSYIYIYIYIVYLKKVIQALPLSLKVGLGRWFWILGYPAGKDYYWHLANSKVPTQIWSEFFTHPTDRRLKSWATPITS